MVEVVEINGEKKFKIGTVKITVNGEPVGELDHFQYDELRIIEQNAVQSIYGGDINVLEKITDVNTTIDITMKEN